LKFEGNFTLTEIDNMDLNEICDWLKGLKKYKDAQYKQMNGGLGG
tara:strand:- start:252 stop:386 length:135 start_codon:yes stop_codon:yes gene_type:complete